MQQLAVNLDVAGGILASQQHGVQPSNAKSKRCLAQYTSMENYYKGVFSIAIIFSHFCTCSIENNVSMMLCISMFNVEFLIFSK